MEAAIRTGDIEAVRAYYTNGKDPNEFINANGNTTTPLIWAINNGKYDIALLLVQLGANPNLYIFNLGRKQSPLISIIRKGADAGFFLEQMIDLGLKVNTALHRLFEMQDSINIGMATIILKSGVDVNSVDEKGFTPLLVLARRKKTPDAIFNKLVAADANVNATLPSGENVLDIAFRAQNYDLLRLLLKLPQFKLIDKEPYRILREIDDSLRHLQRDLDDYDDDNNYGPPPQPPASLTNAYNSLLAIQNLFELKLKAEKAAEIERMKGILATAEGKSAEEKAAILQEVTPTLTAFLGNHLLHGALVNEDADLMHLLIAVGADINDIDQNGESLIWSVVKKGIIPLVDELLAQGVDINQVNEKRLTLASLAVKTGDHDMLDFLLDRGVIIDRGYLMMIATNQRDEFMIEHLAERGVDVNAPTEDNETPLTYALQKGLYDIARVLINVGADVNIADGQYAPIHYAVFSGDSGFVQEMLDAGAQHDVVSAEGETALQIATRLGYHEITLMLQELVAPLEAPDQSMWKGFTRGDAEQFDRLFETDAPAGQRSPAENFSCCPVCMKFVERTTGCMYITHNCSLTGRHHSALYRKYRGPDGSIEWCTVCGRITNGHHAHYKVGTWDGPKPGLMPNGNPFESDCRISSGGGGISEKFMRARAVREEGLRLNALIGQITNQEAYMRLVQAAWNAPATQSANTIATIMSEKKWNKASANYPAPVANNNGPVPNANDPTSYEVPLVLVPGDDGYEGNSVSLNDGMPVIILKHKDSTGAMRTHSAISAESLLSDMQLSGTKGNKCFMPDCGGVLWPREVELAFADPKLAPTITPAQHTMVANYRLRFNSAKQAAAAANGPGAVGGAKTRRQKRRALTTRRRQKNRHRK
jgi:ankyrin repeat protein